MENQNLVKDNKFSLNKFITSTSKFSWKATKFPVVLLFGFGLGVLTTNKTNPITIIPCTTALTYDFCAKYWDSFRVRELKFLSGVSRWSERFYADTVLSNTLLLQQICSRIIDDNDSEVDPNVLERLNYLVYSLTNNTKTADIDILTTVVLPVAEAIDALISRPNFFVQIKSNFEEASILLRLIQLSVRITLLSKVRNDNINNIFMKVPELTMEEKNLFRGDTASEKILAASIFPKILFCENKPEVLQEVKIEELKDLKYIKQKKDELNQKKEEMIQKKEEIKQKKEELSQKQAGLKQKEEPKKVSYQELDTYNLPKGFNTLKPMLASYRWRMSTEERIENAIENIWLSLISAPRNVIQTCVWSFDDINTTKKYVERTVNAKRAINNPTLLHTPLLEADYKEIDALVCSSRDIQNNLKKLLEYDNNNRIIEFILNPSPLFVSKAKGVSLMSEITFNRIGSTLFQAALMGMFAYTIVNEDGIEIVKQVPNNIISYLKFLFFFLPWPKPSFSEFDVGHSIEPLLPGDIQLKNK